MCLGKKKKLESVNLPLNNTKQHTVSLENRLMVSVNRIIISSDGGPSSVGSIPQAGGETKSLHHHPHPFIIILAPIVSDVLSREP